MKVEALDVNVDVQELWHGKQYTPPDDRALSFREMYYTSLAESARTDMKSEELCGSTWTFRHVQLDLKHSSPFLQKLPRGVIKQTCITCIRLKFVLHCKHLLCQAS